MVQEYLLSIEELSASPELQDKVSKVCDEHIIYNTKVASAYEVALRNVVVVFKFVMNVI